MKEYFRKAHFRNVRSSKYVKATIIKHWISIILMLLGLVWLATSGIGILFEHKELTDPNPSKWLIVFWPYYPHVKLTGIIIGYLSVFLNYSDYYDKLKIRYGKYPTN